MGERNFGCRVNMLVFVFVVVSSFWNVEGERKFSCRVYRLILDVKLCIDWKYCYWYCFFYYVVKY